MKKYISVMMALLLAVFALSACGGGQSDSDASADTDATQTADDGQNPIMNFVGTYAEGRAYINIEADGTSGVKAFVSWGSSAWQHSEWTMSGSFDADKLLFTYSDGVRKDYEFGDDGEMASETEVYSGGTGSMQFADDGGSLTLVWNDEKEHMADDLVFSYASTPEDQSGAANPWSVAATAEEAAEGAGIDGFDIEGGEISLGEMKVSEYRYMDGLAEAQIDFPAAEMTIRKGRADQATSSNNVADGDISGDYNVYENSWTQNIKGLEVTCFGNREGEASKIIWQLSDYCYSIVVQGLGGDDDFGLSPDDINSIVTLSHQITDLEGAS